MRILVGFCLVAGSGFGANAIAQAPSSTPDSGVPTLKVNTRLTLVDVTATDSKQKPVHGLTKPDFTLKEDDKPQPIKNFEEYGAERPAEQAPPLPPDVYSNRPASQPTTRALNILMLDHVSTGFVNHLRMSPDYFMVAKQQAVKYLQNIPSGTEIAILDVADGLRVMHGFTSDKALLIAAVNSASTTMVPMTYLPSGGTIASHDACLVANRQSELALEALAQATEFVSGIKGRKNLVWFTPGIPWLTDYSGFVADHPGAYTVASMTTLRSFTGPTTS